MRFHKIQLSIISALFVSLFSTVGCTNKYQVEVTAIDSLIARNKKTLDFINIDLITINERRIEMNGQIAVLGKIEPDSSMAEFQMNLERYKGILRIYKKFIQNYDIIYNRVHFNEKQLSNLRNSVVDEKISGSDFKLAIKKETDNVNDNLINAQTFGQKIFQLEPDYQRLSAYFDGQVKGAIAKFPELKQVLADNSK